MTLTFNLETWFLIATHLLIMTIICAKLFLKSTMHNKVIDRTGTGFTDVYAQNLSADCDLDLWSSDMVLVPNTSSCHDEHLCQIIFKSHHVRLSYGPDTILEHTKTHYSTYIIDLSEVCSQVISNLDLSSFLVNIEISLG